MTFHRSINEFMPGYLPLRSWYSSEHTNYRLEQCQDLLAQTLLKPFIEDTGGTAEVGHENTSLHSEEMRRIMSSYLVVPQHELNYNKF